MKITKKILSAVTAFACAVGMMSVMGTAVSAAEQTYGVFTYVNNGSSIEITDCDSKATSAKIPSEIGGVPVTSIGSYAFDGCYYIKSIVIPDSVKTIGDHAFFACFDLTNVSMTDSVTSIGEAAFYGCDSLRSIKLSDNLTELSDQMLGGCDNLKSFNIPSKATTIGHHFVTGSQKLCVVTIPANITSIDYGAFSDCTNLNRITIENANCVINDSEITISNGWVYEGDVADHVYFNGTIYGVGGSKAQAYANKYGYRFATIGSAFKGDITADGIINLYDAIEIAKSVMGMRTFTEAEVSAADYNNDGVANLYDIVGIATEIM